MNETYSAWECSALCDVHIVLDTNKTHPKRRYYCDACPERSLPSPWKPTRITCTSSSRAGRAHLRLVTAGLDKPPQHTHWWDMSPEDSMLTLKSALYSREQRLTGQPRTRARHGGQPLESASTARRTATGEHEHKSSGEHRSPTHDREKPTSPKPSLNSPSGAFIWLLLVVWFFTPLHWPYCHPGSGESLYRSSAASPTPCTPTGSRHAEPPHGGRSRGGHRVGGGHPTSGGGGASAAVSPEGEPGATHAGGYL